MAALGTVTEMPKEGPSLNEYHVGLLDYWDYWQKVDPRLQPHHNHLSPLAWTVGPDIVHMATYVYEICAAHS